MEDPSIKRIEHSPWAHNSKYVLNALDDHTKLLDRLSIDIGELRLEVTKLQVKAGIVAGVVAAVASAFLTWFLGRF